MAKIKQIVAREILDAKGFPTVEARVVLQDGTTAIASCPSGTSKSTYEAFELRDGDQNRFLGQGVLRAIDNIHKYIAPQLQGIEALNQQGIDRALIELDGTQTKTKLGANATLPVSMAVAKAAAKSAVMPLFLYLRNYINKENLSLRMPSPIMNLINGGIHGGNNIDFQEFLLIPASYKPFSESIHIGFIVYNELKEQLRKKSLNPSIGDEGGFAPNFESNDAALSLISGAVSSTKWRLGYDIFIGIDAAAKHFYQDQQYKIKDKANALHAVDLIGFYEEMIKKYHILYLEDPLSEDDWDGWTALFPRLSQKSLIAGDDITATNPFRLQSAIYKNAINCVTIKPNQIGTVIETLAVVEMARHAGLKITVSSRSGETNDDFVADLAVGISADYVKFGAPTRGERVAKYNRLLQIERSILESMQRQ